MSDRIAALRDWFGLTALQCRVLLALYDAAHPVAKREIAADIGSTDGSVAVSFLSIREALDDDALDAFTGAKVWTYRLTPTGRAEVASVLAQYSRQST